MSVDEHHIAVRRSARYHTLGEAGPALRDVWFVLHGHGQLSAYFIRNFEPLQDATRLIVAPEAMNRFYLDHGVYHGSPKARVGATWMTREDRLVDIDDNVAYLDALHDSLCGALDRSNLRVTVLGFSQGVQAAVRWVCLGRVRPDAVVMWAGSFPPELDQSAVAPLSGMTLTWVLGDKDEIAPEEMVAAETARLGRLGLNAELVRFDGGHELNAGVLRKLAV